jgi:Anti-sigma-28 factor, FlgM
MPTEIPDERAMYVESIKARVARADYVVDPSAVAEAMLRRPELFGSASRLAVRPVRRRAHSPRAGGQGPNRRG